MTDDDNEQREIFDPKWFELGHRPPERFRIVPVYAASLFVWESPDEPDEPKIVEVKVSIRPAHVDPTPPNVVR